MAHFRFMMLSPPGLRKFPDEPSFKPLGEEAKHLPVSKSPDDSLIDVNQPFVKTLCSVNGPVDHIGHISIGLIALGV